jgi:hypothetical protein
MLIKRYTAVSCLSRKLLLFCYRQQVTRCYQSQSQSQSHSHIATDGQSVCLGVEPKSGTFDQRFFFSKLLSCLFWGALSDERSGLSCVSLCLWSLQWSVTIYKIFTFKLQIHKVLNTFTKSIKYIQYIQGLVQSRLCTADYALFTSYLVYHTSLRHLNSRTHDRRQVWASYTGRGKLTSFLYEYKLI